MKNNSFNSFFGEDEEEKGISKIETAESDSVNDDTTNLDDSSHNEDENEETEPKVTSATKSSNTFENVKAKKEDRNLFIVFASLYVVVIMILSYFIFFSNSVVGTWKYDKDGEGKETYALVLNDDGTAKYTTGSSEVRGTYKVNGSDSINLNIKAGDNDILSGDFSFHVSGGLASKSLNLFDSKGQSMKLVQYKLEDTVHPVSNFVADKDILGKWAYGTDSENATYEFKDDGTMVMTAGNVTMTFTYAVNDGIIKFMQYFLKDSNDSPGLSRARYLVKDGKLRIGGRMILHRV